MSHLSGIIKADLVRMKQAIDLRDDLWELGGLQHREGRSGHVRGGGRNETGHFPVFATM